MTKSERILALEGEVQELKRNVEVLFRERYLDRHWRENIEMKISDLYADKTSPRRR